MERRPQFRGLTDVAEIRGGLGSEGAKSILDACLKTAGSTAKPDLSDVDRTLWYVEVIKEAGDNVLVTLTGDDGTQESMSLYHAIIDAGAKLVRAATENQVRQLKLKAAEEAVAAADAAVEHAATVKAEADVETS